MRANPLGVAGRAQNRLAVGFGQAAQTRVAQALQMPVEIDRRIERPAAIRDGDEALAVGVDPKIGPAAKALVGRLEPQSAAPEKRAHAPVRGGQLGRAFVERHFVGAECDGFARARAARKRQRGERAATKSKRAAPRRVHLPRGTGFQRPLQASVRANQASRRRQPSRACSGR
jgi:hypothetical protein